MNKEQSNLHTQPYLKRGDKNGLISTDRKISKKELQKNI